MEENMQNKMLQVNNNKEKFETLDTFQHNYFLKKSKFSSDLDSDQISNK